MDQGAEVEGGQNTERVAEWIGELSGRGIRVVNEEDETFPDALRHIPDPPLVLYARERMDVLARRCVAIVGSRRASSNGMLMARRCAETLASLGVVVVSGLASGIDSAAHGGGRSRLVV